MALPFLANNQGAAEPQPWAPAHAQNLANFKTYWQKRASDLQQRGLDPTIYQSVIQQDLEAVRGGGRPMTDRDAALAIAQRLKGGSVVPDPESGDGSLTDYLVKYPLEDLRNIVTSLPKLPAAMIHEAQSLQDAPKVFADIQSSPDSDTLEKVGQVLHEVPGVRMIPGAYTAGNLAERDFEQIAKTPVSTFLDVLPAAKATGAGKVASEALHIPQLKERVFGHEGVLSDVSGRRDTAKQMSVAERGAMLARLDDPMLGRINEALSGFDPVTHAEAKAWLEATQSDPASVPRVTPQPDFPHTPDQQAAIDRMLEIRREIASPAAVKRDPQRYTDLVREHQRIMESLPDGSPYKPDYLQPAENYPNEAARTADQIVREVTLDTQTKSMLSGLGFFAENGEFYSRKTAEGAAVWRSWESYNSAVEAAAKARQQLAKADTKAVSAEQALDDKAAGVRPAIDMALELDSLRQQGRASLEKFLSSIDEGQGRLLDDPLGDLDIHPATLDYLTGKKVEAPDEARVWTEDTYEGFSKLPEMVRTGERRAAIAEGRSHQARRKWGEWVREKVLATDSPFNVFARRGRSDLYEPAFFGPEVISVLENLRDFYKAEAEWETNRATRPTEGEHPEVRAAREEGRPPPYREPLPFTSPVKAAVNKVRFADVLTRWTQGGRLPATALDTPLAFSQEAPDPVMLGENPVLGADLTQAGPMLDSKMRVVDANGQTQWVQRGQYLISKMSELDPASPEYAQLAAEYATYANPEQVKIPGRSEMIAENEMNARLDIRTAADGILATLGPDDTSPLAGHLRALRANLSVERPAASDALAAFHLFQAEREMAQMVSGQRFIVPVTGTPELVTKVLSGWQSRRPSAVVKLDGGGYGVDLAQEARILQGATSQLERRFKAGVTEFYGGKPTGSTTTQGGKTTRATSDPSTLKPLPHQLPPGVLLEKIGMGEVKITPSGRRGEPFEVYGSGISRDMTRGALASDIPQGAGDAGGSLARAQVLDEYRAEVQAELDRIKPIFDEFTKAENEARGLRVQMEQMDPQLRALRRKAQRTKPENRMTTEEAELQHLIKLRRKYLAGEAEVEGLADQAGAFNLSSLQAIEARIEELRAQGVSAPPSNRRIKTPEGEPDLPSEAVRWRERQREMGKSKTTRLAEARRRFASLYGDGQTEGTLAVAGRAMQDYHAKLELVGKQETYTPALVKEKDLAYSTATKALESARDDLVWLKRRGFRFADGADPALPVAKMLAELKSRDRKLGVIDRAQNRHSAAAKARSTAEEQLAILDERAAKAEKRYRQTLTRAPASRWIPRLSPMLYKRMRAGVEEYARLAPEELEAILAEHDAVLASKEARAVARTERRKAIDAGVAAKDLPKLPELVKPELSKEFDVKLTVDALKTLRDDPERILAKLERESFEGVIPSSEVFRLRREIAEQVDAMRASGVSPRFVHHTKPEAVRSITRTRLKVGIKDPAQARARTWDLAPHESNLQVLLSDAEAEWIDRTWTMYAVYGKPGDADVPGFMKWAHERDADGNIVRDVDGAMKPTGGNAYTTDELFEKHEPEIRGLAERTGIDLRMATQQYLKKHYRTLKPMDYINWSPVSHPLTRPGGGELAVTLPDGNVMNVPAEAWVPKGVYKTFSEMMPRSGGPSLMYQTYDKALNVFRLSVLAFSPRVLFYNLFGGAFMLGARTDPTIFFDYWSKARDMVGAVGTESQKMPLRLSRGAVFTPDFVSELATDPGKAARFKWGAELAEFTKKMASKSFEINEWTDNMYRAMAYLYGKDKALTKGLTEAESIERGLDLSNKILQDWDTMLPWERTVLRNVFPFYGWMRHILKYTYTYPFDHPLRASIVGAFSRSEVADAQSGLPDKFRQIAWIGSPDADGSQWTANLGGLNPWGDVADMFTLSGFVGASSPALQGLLEAMGVDMSSARSRLYPEMEYDPETGRLIAKGRPAWEAVIGSFIPQSQALFAATGWSKNMRELHQKNPEAWKSVIFNSLGVPLAPRKRNLYSEVYKTDNARLDAARAAVGEAMSTGDWSEADRYDLTTWTINGRTVIVPVAQLKAGLLRVQDAGVATPLPRQ